jgi:hypothetical protein
MAAAVKLSEEVVSEARIVSKAMNRSVAGQVEYWVRIGKIAEENPDLTFEFIKQILISRQEAKAKLLQPYHFGSR